MPLALRGDKPLGEVQRQVEDAARRLTDIDLEPGLDDPLAFAVTTMVELAWPPRLPRHLRRARVRDL